MEFAMFMYMAFVRPSNLLPWMLHRETNVSNETAAGWPVDVKKLRNSQF
jgi:hypothetical protein